MLAKGSRPLGRTEEDVQPLKNRPSVLALLVVICALGGFVIAGWLGSVNYLVIDWKPFHDSDALIFLGAFSQLVLAAAVWYQIRTADEC